MTPAFRRFWLGQTASNLGDAFGFVAMPLLVFELTRSVVQMGTVTAIASAGQLVAALFAGVVVDRVHRRRLMILCDLARMALYAALPFAHGISAVYVVAALTGLAGNLFNVAYVAAVPNLVEPAQVAGANARLQAAQALTFVVGSALAGTLAHRFGPGVALAVDSASFALSAASLATITFRRDTGAAASEGVFAQLRSGLRYLAGHPALRALTLFQTAVALLGSIGLGAAVIDLIVFRIRSDLGGTSALVGACLATAAFGAALGAVTSARVHRRIGLGRAVLAGTALQAVGLVAAGSGHAVGFVVAGALLWAAGLTFRSVAGMSLRQLATPDALMGRVVAAGWVGVLSGAALGALFVTHVAARFGTAHALTAIGALLAAVTVAGAMAPDSRAAADIVAR